MSRKAFMSFPIISKNYPLILASASPRRKRLLRQIGLPFRSLPSNLEETQVMGNPPVRARLLAEKKALSVHSRSNKSWVLGADTMVVLGKTILSKPKDHDEAQSRLFLLSGKGHNVVTGFCVLDPSGDIAHAEAISTLVKVKSLREEEIMAYVATGEPFGKAGGYAIQGIGSFMVESISGSYSNVVGLPLYALIRSLLATGALKNFPSLPGNAWSNPRPH
ncbi:MAG: Maf family protein [Desulfatiglandales bacterium]|nr:Maf family protein [Desulfatiglandales bacterium]